MATITVEQGYTEHHEDGAWGATKTLQVRSDADAVISASDALAALPALGSTLLVGGVTTYLRSRNLQQRTFARARVWDATLEWRSSANPAASFTVTSSSVAAITIDVWRSGASLPGDLSAPAESDIGGTKVDMRGEPISALIVQQRLTIKNIVSSIDYATIRNYIGKRNSATFLGVSAGFLLFEGTDDQRIDGGRYEIEYRFLYDSTAHLRQVCARDVDGHPKLNTDAIPKASTILWKQPFPGTAAFAGLGIVL